MPVTRNRRRERQTATPPGNNNAAGGDDTGIMATVTHWPYCERLPVASMTVAQIRDRYRDRFDIDPLSQAMLDGHEAAGETIVQAGQMLTFIRRAGEKGLGSRG